MEGYGYSVTFFMDSPMHDYFKAVEWEDCTHIMTIVNRIRRSQLDPLRHFKGAVGITELLR